MALCRKAAQLTPKHAMRQPQGINVLSACLSVWMKMQAQLKPKPVSIVHPLIRKV